MAKLSMRSGKFSIGRAYAAIAAMIAVGSRKFEEPKNNAITGGRAFGRTRSTILSRMYRSRNKYSPGNYDTFSKKQLKELQAKNG